MRRLVWSALVSLTAVVFAACGASGTPAASVGTGGPSRPPASAAAPSQAASACQPTSDTANAAAVTIDNFAFSPAVIEAKVGQPIVFTNKEAINHGAILDNDPSCTTGSFGQGGSGGLVFSAAGEYPYHCTVHGTAMTGTIKVTQ